MPEKRMPAIADRAVWEKVTKRRAGMSWNKMGTRSRENMKIFRGRPRRGTVHKVWRVQDRSKRKNRREGKASAKK